MKTHYLVIAALAALALGSCTREKADIDGKPNGAHPRDRRDGCQ